LVTEWIQQVIVITFSTDVTLYGLCVSEMDVPAQQAFRELVANSMSNMSLADVVITGLLDIVCQDRQTARSGGGGGGVHVMAESSLQLTFQTSVSTEAGANVTAVVGSLATELDDAMTSSNFSSDLVNKSVAYGSTTITSNTVLSNGSPRVSRNYTVVSVQTAFPSSVPSLMPSGDPSASPTSVPSAAPTEDPSSVPSSRPTGEPSSSPSGAPSGEPSGQPSGAPTGNPTDHPSGEPSGQPSSSPSGEPSCVPSFAPTDSPSAVPSAVPSFSPVVNVTRRPTRVPTMSPTAFPTPQPTDFYSGYDIRNALLADVGRIPEDISSLELYANSHEGGDYAKAESDWSAFIADNFDNSIFDLDYSMYVTSSVMIEGETEVPDTYTASCSDSTITNAIIAHLVADDASTSAEYTCGSLTWEVRGRALCVNCPNASLLCPERGTHVVSPSTTTCPDGTLHSSKTGIIVGVYSTIKLPDSVPKLQNITLSSDQESITVSLSVSTSGYGGKVYCAAFAAPATLLSNFAIREKGFGASTPRLEVLAEGIEHQRVAITGLTADQEYDVFCFTEDSSGNQMSLAVVKSLSQNTTTACCRQVEFTNVPLSVNGDYTSYPAASDTDSYKIKVQVLDTPSTEIEVIPMLYHRNGTLYSGDNIHFIPESVTFTSTNTDYSSKTGSFLIDATADAGKYMLQLEVAGSGKDQFEANANSFSNFSIVLDTPIPDSPSLKSAIFSNSGSNIFVQMTAPIDLSRFSQQVSAQSWSCGKLLDFPGSSQSTCVWKNSTFLSIQLSSSSSVQPLHEIRLQDSDVPGFFALYAYCIQPDGDCSAYTASSTASFVTISFPQSPITPTPSLLIPSSIGLCDDLLVDFSLSSGHGGRAWKNIYWVVTSDDGSSVTDILATLKAVNPADTNGTVTVRKDIFVAAHAIAVQSFVNVTIASSTKYIISVGFENYLQNLTASQVFYQNKEITVDRSSNAPPTVTIIGNAKRVVLEGSAVRLNAKGTASTCDNTLSIANKLTYKWQLYSEFVRLPSITAQNTAANPKYFTLPANVLTAGKTYQVVITATDSFTASSSDFVSVYVQPKPVTVHVPGGVNRLVPAQERLSLSVEGSATALIFSWTCFFQTLSSKYGTSCLSVVQHCNTNTTTALSTCTIAASSVSVDDIMLFTVTATSATSAQSGSSQIVVTVTDPVKSAQATVVSPYEGGKFNTHTKLQLNCSISGNLTSLLAQWSLVDSDYLALSDAGVSLTQTSRSFQFTESSPTTVQVVYMSVSVSWTAACSLCF
jgi:hypothetical protein